MAARSSRPARRLYACRECETVVEPVAVTGGHECPACRIWIGRASLLAGETI